MVDDRHRSRRARLAHRFGLTSLAGMRTAVATDFRTARWMQRLALLGVVLWLVYEWGPGNETVTPWLLAGIIEDNSGVAVIPITAAVAFTFTLLQQLASGFTALAGFSLFRRTADASWTKLRGADGVAPGEWSALGWTGRCAVVFGLGTTAVALIQVMTTGQVGVRRHARVVSSSALLCGAMLAFIGATGASIAYVGRRVRPLARPTRAALTVLENPLFWVGLVVVIALLHAARRPASTRV